MFQVFEDNAGGLYLFVFDGEEMVYACMGFEHTPGNLRQCVEELQTQGLNAVQGWEGNREPWDGLEATPEETHAQLCDWVHQGMGGARIIADQDGIYYDRMGASGSIEFKGGHEMSTKVEYREYGDVKITIATGRVTYREGGQDCFDVGAHVIGRRGQARAERLQLGEWEHHPEKRNRVGRLGAYTILPVPQEQVERMVLAVLRELGGQQ